ncbi:MAG TPA: substrate-binding domain-containing protein [Caproiciproducens sp.]|nr:substrate-binding domain-containing protein [Caproiciproducens sp.]
MKKGLALVLTAAIAMSSLVGCSSSQPTGSAAAGTAAATNNTTAQGGGGDLQGANVFMFKSTGNSFGDKMYEGFKEVITKDGGKPAYKSPAETTVAAQVKLIDELITQKVASITISTNGDTGYDEVFKKAKAAGIKIVSVDSKASPDYRITHVDPTSQEGVGQSLVQAATMIALKKDYPANGDLKAATEDALKSYSGKEIKLGVLSASIDTPVQNGWIAKMEEELKRDVYKGKVSATLTKKYGNDDPTASTTQANAFISENNVDVIISPTTVGMVAAGQALKSNPSCKIKLTGLGLPSEMSNFMPAKASDNAFDAVCPYMFLWDVYDLGRVAAGATWASIKDGYTGAVGSSFKMGAFGDYKERTFTTIQHPADKGTEVLVGKPYSFYKENIAEWVKKL